MPADDFHAALSMLDDPLLESAPSAVVADTAGDVIMPEDISLADEPTTSGLNETFAVPKVPKKAKAVPEEKEKVVTPEETDEEPETSKADEKDEESHRLMLQVVLSNFNQQQLDRYEAMRRASFPKSVIKRLCNQYTGVPISQNVTIAIAALDIQQSMGDEGALTPRHLDLAYMKLDDAGKLFPVKPRRNPLL
ncbi:unnamed protein product [Bursaphelenchus okinawaensis]|uniref:TAFII28-like protein domain-containing protein n=1 Tax=Bursaphelenchus okinawaensis TaxID=465554 RepID=A0A811KSA7_9BILA|nr:unnamed protein product [Bursaphelenchus okinawaensis]CAG9111271.1 unnamed protein product [Bursaphelenchus okinawaensis]